MLLKLTHHTRFAYAHRVALSHQLVRLSPRSFERQQVLQHAISVTPEPDYLETRLDAFGNEVREILIQAPHDQLTIESRAVVDVLDPDNIMLDLSPPWHQVAETLYHPRTPAALDASEFAFPSPHIDLAGVGSFAEDLFAPGVPLLRLANNLSRRIYEQFEYQGGVTDVYTPVPDVLRAGRGVCQDFAHVAIARLRAAGLAARYVSGYLLTHPPEGETRLTGADASHAWISVWCPEFGWVDFDPTNDLIPGTGHITLGWGRDYSDVSPTKGFIHGGGAQTLEVAVDVAPLPTLTNAQEQL